MVVVVERVGTVGHEYSVVLHCRRGDARCHARITARIVEHNEERSLEKALKKL